MKTLSESAETYYLSGAHTTPNDIQVLVQTNDGFISSRVRRGAAYGAIFWKKVNNPENGAPRRT
jgi:hypothetical protein